MRLLLIESAPGDGAAVTERLTAAGHDVDRCYDDVTASPCRGIRDDATCPMHHPLDLAVVVREAGAAATLMETGAICAQRHRVPVVTVDPDDAHVSATVRTAAAAGRALVERRYAEAVRASLAERRVGVDVRREDTTVRVRLRTAETLDAAERAALADGARAAVRRFDPFVAVIDVAVVAGRP